VTRCVKHEPPHQRQVRGTNRQVTVLVVEWHADQYDPSRAIAPLDNRGLSVIKSRDDVSAGDVAGARIPEEPSGAQGRL